MRGTRASGPGGGVARRRSGLRLGLQDNTFTGMNTGFQARIARFNAQGGLDGRKIDFVGVLNDGDSLSTSTVFSIGESVGWWSAEEFIQELQATAAKGPLTQLKAPYTCVPADTINVTGG